jgi:hypothetical protein
MPDNPALRRPHGNLGGSSFPGRLAVGWSAQVLRAGDCAAPLPGTSPTRWSRESIVTALRDWHRRTGCRPTVTDWTPSQVRSPSAGELFATGAFPHASTVRAQFGTWSAAMQAAGLGAAKRCYRVLAAPRTPLWLEADIIAAIRDWAAVHDGEPPSYQQWSPNMARRRARPDMADDFYQGTWPHGSVVVREFGSWSAAISAAGFRSRPPGGQPT